MTGLRVAISYIVLFLKYHTKASAEGWPQSSRGIEDEVLDDWYSFYWSEEIYVMGND